MSDLEPELEAILDRGQPEEAAPEPAPEPATPSDIEPEDPAPAEPEHPETVAWDEHVKLRHENAEYRKRWQPIEQTFDGIHPDDAAALLDLAKTYKEDPRQAAEIMRQYADALSAEREAAGVPEGGEQKYLTPEEFDRRWAERESKQRNDQLVADIEREAQTLGYTPGTRDYVSLLHAATNETNGDIKKADALLKSERQRIIDEFVAAQAKGSTVTPAPQTGVAPSGERVIGGLDDADNAFRESMGIR